MPHPPKREGRTAASGRRPTAMRSIDFGGNGTEMGIVKTSSVLPIVAALAAFSLAFAQTARADKDPVVVMKTSEGTMEITLDPEHSPITVKNFLSYVDEKFYDGTL